MSQSLQATIIPVTPFQQNCSLLWCTETKKAAVVDPGGDLDTIDAAIAVGARTIAITCDPGSPLAESVEISIAPRVGAEVVTGSTRMKGGLAQKMILSALSTSVMVRMGRVRGNHMTHISPDSSKLRGRAVRIVMELGKVDRARAREILRSTEGSVEMALEILDAERSTEST